MKTLLGLSGDYMQKVHVCDHVCDICILVVTSQGTKCVDVQYFFF